MVAATAAQSESMHGSSQAPERGRDGVQYKDRVDLNLIKPAVDWRKTPVGSGTMGAAVAK